MSPADRKAVADVLRENARMLCDHGTYYGGIFGVEMCAAYLAWMTRGASFGTGMHSDKDQPLALCFAAAMVEAGDWV
jgi:hypothetical protein